MSLFVRPYPVASALSIEMLSKTLSIALGLIACVAGHGYVEQETVGGVQYTGYLPYQDPYYNPPPQRIVRRVHSLGVEFDSHLSYSKIPGNGPVTDLSLIDVQCNGWSDGGIIGSAPAPLVATAAPGTTVTFKWTPWPNSHVGRTYD